MVAVTEVVERVLVAVVRAVARAERAAAVRAREPVVYRAQAE